MQPHKTHFNLCADPLVLTLVTADAFEADAAVAGSRHVITGGVVHALTQLLAAVAKSPGRTLWTWEQRFKILNIITGCFVYCYVQ